MGPERLLDGRYRRGFTKKSKAVGFGGENGDNAIGYNSMGEKESAEVPTKVYT